MEFCFGPGAARLPFAPMALLELCVEGLEDVRVARAAGVARVELAAALVEGGLTPGPGLLERAAAEPGIECVALLRPRGGDFLYSPAEFEVLRADLEALRGLGLAGVALGCLTAEGEVDEERTRELVERARPLKVTFHRAFDGVRDPRAALESLLRLGVDRVLTSGQAASALEGAPRLAQLVDQARGRIEVIAAGGVRPANVRQVLARSGVPAVHCALMRRLPSAMRSAREAPSLASGGRTVEAFDRWETDPEALGALLAGLR